MSRRWWVGPEGALSRPGNEAQGPAPRFLFALAPHMALPCSAQHDSNTISHAQARKQTLSSRHSFQN